MDLDFRDFEEESRLFEGQKTSQTETGNDYDPNEFDEMPVFKKLDGIGRDQDRYVWFGGNVMSANEKNSRADLFLGGENFGPDFPALAISRFALMRGRITPITLAPRSQARDEPMPNPTVTPFEGDLVNAGELSRVRHVKAFPGDQLEAIVFGARDGRGKGIVELTEFQKMSYSERNTKQAIFHVQRAIFPDWDAWMMRKKVMPPTLRALEALIREAADKYKDEQYIPKTCSEMLTGCGQFRLYGVGYLQREGLRVRMGVHPNGGYVHQYSGVAEELLIQLEMKRESLQDADSDLYKGFDVEKLIEGFAKVTSENLNQIRADNRAMIEAVLGANVFAKPEDVDLKKAAEQDLEEQLKEVSRETLIEKCKELGIEYPQKANKLQLWKLLEKAKTDVNNN